MGSIPSLLQFVIHLLFVRLLGGRRTDALQFTKIELFSGIEITRSLVNQMSNANQPLVLIADDDPEVLALLGTHIGRWGYRVLLARGKG